MNTAILQKTKYSNMRWINPVARLTFIAHIDSCEHCRNEVASYQLLFSAMTEQSAPAFDFDLSASGIASIAGIPPSPYPQIVSSRVSWLFSFAPASAIPVYLFRQYLLNMFSDILQFLHLCHPCAVR